MNAETVKAKLAEQCGLDSKIEIISITSDFVNADGFVVIYRQTYVAFHGREVSNMRVAQVVNGEPRNEILLQNFGR